MALGTTVARLTGYLRSILLVAALGNALHADVFAIANTIPNMLVVLLGAGIFNAVLVPQIVRADMRGEGAAYLNQVITLFGALLLVATLLLTLAAPWVMTLFLSPELAQPQLASQHHAAIVFAYCCLPQVFFYGIFALVGQILNSREVFAPMMWAPVLNNVVAVGVLGTYLGTYGVVTDRCGGYSAGQALLLGIGMTSGVVVQCLALVPYLRRAGIRYRPTARLLSPGIRATIRLGAWTLAVVLVNQLAYGVVVRLASAGTAAVGGCAAGSSAAGTGYTIYSSAYLLIMAPHAVVTVSLMTASLPGLAAVAASGRLRELGERLSWALRLVMVVIVPGVALLEVLAPTMSDLVWGYGAGAGSSSRFAPTLMCFGAALVFFTGHYVALRGLYALGATSAVFGVQSVIAAANVGLAVVLVRLTGPAMTAPALASAYGVAYAIGSLISWTLLHRRLGTIERRRTLAGLARVSACAGLAAVGCASLLYAVSGQLLAGPGSKIEALAVAASTTLLFTGLFVLSSCVVHVPELGRLVRMLAGRGPGRSMGRASSTGR